MRRDIPVPRSRAAGWARLIGALAVPVLVVGGLGNRAGFVPPEALVPVLFLGFALAVIAVGLGIYALVDIWHSGAEGTGTAIAGIVYALPALLMLGFVAAAALVYPRLTDVTTNVGDPPALTAAGDRPSEAPDADFVALQTDAYPDIAPRLYQLPIANVYAATRRLVDERNWTVTQETPPPSLPPEVEAEAEPAAGSETPETLDGALGAKATMTQSRGSAVPPIEAAAEEPEPTRETATLQAVARTLLFGFPDDVVIRIRETSQGTQIDMRSTSRTGMHDLGQNARRIRQFFADLDLALQPDPNAPVSSPAGAVVAEPVAVPAEASAAVPAEAAASVGQ